jgi:hypothetical protein
MSIPVLADEDADSDMLTEEKKKTTCSGILSPERFGKRNRNRKMPLQSSKRAVTVSHG